MIRLLLSFITSLYLISALSLVHYLRSLNHAGLKMSRTFLGVALALNLGLLFTWFAARGYWVPINSADSDLVLSAFLGLVAWILSAQKQRLNVVIFLLPLILASLILLFFLDHRTADAAVPLAPWLWTHVLLMLLGEAFFLFAAAVSLLYLVLDHRLRTGRASKVLVRPISSLPDLDKFLGEILFVGHLLLTLGMALGFFFAEQYWQKGWLQDPKVVLCLVTWLVYFCILCMRLLRTSFRGKRTAQASVLGFLLTIVLVWGLDLFVRSNHLWGQR